MPEPVQQRINNHLLKSLPPHAFEAIKHHLISVDLPVGTALALPGQAITQHFFPDGGLASALARSGDGQVIEAGLLGYGAMTGHEMMLMVDQHPNEVIMQIVGSGWQLSSQALRDLVENDPATRSLLLRFVHFFQLQIIHSGLANARYKVHQRLARWLLMTHDRVLRDDLLLTHELLAMMLGVRRAGVTDALHLIEGSGAIRSTRGVVRVLARGRLEEIAAGSYGIPERAYRQLFCQTAEYLPA